MGSRFSSSIAHNADDFKPPTREVPGADDIRVKSGDLDPEAGSKAIGKSVSNSPNEEITKQAIEATCSTIADKILEEIHENPDSSTNKLIAEFITEQLNSQLSKNKTPAGKTSNVHKRGVGTKRGYCQSAAKDSAIEWTIETAINNVNDTFTATCGTLTSCTATMHDTKLYISWSAGQGNSLYRESSAMVDSSSNLSMHTSLLMPVLLLLLLIHYLHQ
ncbi:hypothetical protein INT47_005907 [Mucor saturninus]|uniref:Uncharacterized protein n=1 Tax=Mucor saturninus TaxID=64648 RepID=A0A8H7R7C7_9FUNG|nr:hypothetical protein INT47_005907 [Mucor saturninus]